MSRSDTMASVSVHLDRAGSILTDDELLGLDAVLGRLAVWWLSDASIARTEFIHGGRRRPAPSLLEGEFAVLFQRLADHSWLQPALALPLRWTLDRDADESWLPRQLRSLAIHVRERMPPAGAPLEPGRFRLALGAGCPNLADLDMPADSAGAVLYAALRCAMHEVSPSMTSTASARLGTLGLEGVDGIDEKCIAAARIGITEVAVARAQETPRSPSNASVKLRPLSGVSITEQLAKLVEALDAPPYEGAFEQRRDWYNRMPPGGSEQHTRFYAASLVKDLASRIRDNSVPPDLDTLVLYAGRIVEPLLLAAETLRAERVILLHSDDGKESAPERSLALFAHLSRRPSIERVRLKRDATQRDVSVQLSQVLRHDERIGIDITPGPKDVAFYLERFARAWKGPHRCTCTYITSSTDNGRARYGVSDRLLILYPSDE